MFERFINFLKSEDDLDPSFIRLTRNILVIVLVTNLAVLPLVTGIAGEGSRNPLAFAALLGSLFVEAIALVLVWQGNLTLAKISVPAALLMAIAAISLNTNGLRDTSFYAIPIVLILSAILMGRRSLFIVTPLVILTSVIVAVRDLSSEFTPLPAGIDDAIIVPLLFLATAGITHIMISRLNETAERARQSEQEKRRENEELMALRASLEDRVRERTLKLEETNQLSGKKAKQFKAVAQVMNAVSSVQSLDELLPLVTRVISQQFDVYHVGIFLLDEAGGSAILRAANSEGGQRMLARKHSLPVGQTGIVGFVTATGQPRIALDVGADSVYFNNPDLPETHSEIALPLQYGGKIIGALDAQSAEPNAFLPDDVEVLVTLADQVSVAITNAQTFAAAQRALAEAQSAVGQTAQEAWQILRPTQIGLGFSYSETGIKPLQYAVDNPQVNEALAKGKTVLTSGPGNWSRLAIPVRLRDKVIGVMQLSSRGDLKLTSDDAEIAEAVAERLSLAIETATLLQSSQRRADLEKVTASIASKVSASTRFDTIIQTAAQELSRALGGSDVIIQIEPASLKMNT
jgi:GAF domain-containing protein